MIIFQGFPKLNSMILIIGLGNYPPEFKNTRHNFGFMAINALAENLEFPPWRLERKFFAEITTGEIKGEKAILCKPQTYMNLSGKAAGAIQSYYKIPVNRCFVFSDDLDLAFGDSRFREKGSGGGQKGINNLIQVFGSQEFPRIKFGISNDRRARMKTEDFVLSRFSKKEVEELPDIIADGLEKFWEKL